MQRVCMFFVFVWMFGCTPMSVDIDPRAIQSVKVVPEAHIKEDCAYVAPLSTRFGNNFVTLDMNVENANNDLINQAHAKGITHLVMQAPAQSTNTNFGFSEGDCNNCVFMTALGYKCGAGAAVAPSAATPTTATSPAPPATPEPATAPADDGFYND